MRLFFIKKLILARTDTTDFLSSQTVPLNSMTRQTTNTHFLVHSIIISQLKMVGATLFIATLKAYLLAVNSLLQSGGKALKISSKK